MEISPVRKEILKEVGSMGCAILMGNAGIGYLMVEVVIACV